MASQISETGIAADQSTDWSVGEVEAVRPSGRSLGQLSWLLDVIIVCAIVLVVTAIGVALIDEVGMPPTIAVLSAAALLVTLVASHVVIRRTEAIREMRATIARIEDDLDQILTAGQPAAAAGGLNRRPTASQERAVDGLQRFGVPPEKSLTSQPSTTESKATGDVSGYAGANAVGATRAGAHDTGRNDTDATVAERTVTPPHVGASGTHSLSANKLDIVAPAGGPTSISEPSNVADAVSMLGEDKATKRQSRPEAGGDSVSLPRPSLAPRALDAAPGAKRLPSAPSFNPEQAQQPDLGQEPDLGQGPDSGQAPDLGQGPGFGGGSAATPPRLPTMNVTANVKGRSERERSDEEILNVLDRMAADINGPLAGESDELARAQSGSAPGLPADAGEPDVNDEQQFVSDAELAASLADVPSGFEAPSTNQTPSPVHRAANRSASPAALSDGLGKAAGNEIGNPLDRASEEPSFRPGQAVDAILPPPLAPAPATPGFSLEGKLGAITEALANERIDIFLEPIKSLNVEEAPYFEVSLRLRLENGHNVERKDYASETSGTPLLPLIDAVAVAKTRNVAWQLGERHERGRVFTALSGGSLIDKQFEQDFNAIMSGDAGTAMRIVLSFPQSDARAFTDAELQTLHRLHTIGFRFAVDHLTDLDTDFDALSEAGFEFVKLDADVFLDGLQVGMTRVPSDDICRHFGSLGLTPIVGHIRRTGQLQRIRNCGVALGQGPLLGARRPLKADWLS